MQIIKYLHNSFKGLSEFCKTAMLLGFYGMLTIYVVGIIAHKLAWLAPNYLNAMSVYYGCLEAAPATLAAGVCAGLICDLVIAGSKKSK